MDKVDNKQKGLIKKIKEFCLLDDDFMSKVFEYDDECQSYGTSKSPGYSSEKVTTINSSYGNKSKGSSTKRNTTTKKSNRRKVLMKLMMTDMTTYIWMKIMIMTDTTGIATTLTV